MIRRDLEPEWRLTPLFDAPRVRKGDPKTSAAASDVVGVNLGALQRAVLLAYAEHGPMSGRDAERLPEFSDLSPSTIRKRISEMQQGGYLAECGVDRSRRAPCTIYSMTPAGAEAIKGEAK